SGRWQLAGLWSRVRFCGWFGARAAGAGTTTERFTTEVTESTEKKAGKIFCAPRASVYSVLSVVEIFTSVVGSLTLRASSLGFFFSLV
ncbi:MAG: hypothetical protein WA347_02790, partial [Rhabdochlamydiaceae bacterium]